MKTAVVILPTYNERDNIGLLIDKVEQEFGQIKNYSMQVLVVDDNSPDGTQKVVRKKQQEFSNVSLLTGKKEGLGKAYIRGIDYAINKLNAHVVFEMDADFSHNPKKIPQLLEKLDQGFDIVVGARYIEGGSIPKNWGVHRKFLSRMGNTMVRTLLVQFKIHDWTSGFRALRVDVYKKVRSELTDFTGYTFQVAFLHKALRRGFKVAEIPIHFVDRRFGKSKIGPEYVINLLVYLVKQTLINPPRFFKFLVVGGFGFILQFISFRILRSFDLRPSIATAISAEIAIISNFIWNNLWTFAERKITSAGRLVYKFFQFNLTSLGSLLIQAGISEVGTRMFGIATVMSLAGFALFSDDLYLMVGILIGLIWNYTMYSLVIWRKKKK